MDKQNKRKKRSPKVLKLLNSNQLRIINMGLHLFAETYQQLGMEVIHVNWQPYAGGNEELAHILSDLNG